MGGTGVCEIGIFVKVFVGGEGRAWLRRVEFGVFDFFELDHCVYLGGDSGGWRRCVECWEFAEQVCEGKVK